MPKVFISYARPDRRLAEDLAHALRERGHIVWWDAHLLGNEEFTAVIERELEAADVVAVIWTATSALSQFVRAEAHKAMVAKKLVGILGPGMSAQALPVPFNVHHGVGFDDRDGILQSIAAVVAGGRRVPAQPVTVSTSNRLFEGGLSLIRRMASALVGLSLDPGAEPADAEALRAAVSDLLRALDTFVAEVSPTEAFSFEDRFLFRRVTDVIETRRPQIIKEKNWLDSYSSPGVIENAKAGIADAARALLAACG